MPAKKPKFNFAIICDDIREEIGNKISFMGVYTKDIFVPKFPFTFPRLCFVMNYENIKGGDIFSAELIDPSGKQIGKKVKGGPPEHIKGYIRFQFHMIVSPLIAKEEGNYKLIALINANGKSKKEINFAIKKPDEVG